MNDIKIDIVVPVFNEEKYLDNCITSILNFILNIFYNKVLNKGSRGSGGSLTPTHINKKKPYLENYGSSNIQTYLPA